MKSGGVESRRTSVVKYHLKNKPVVTTYNDTRRLTPPAAAAAARTARTARHT